MDRARVLGWSLSCGGQDSSASFTITPVSLTLSLASQSGGLAVDVAFVCKTGHEGGDGWVCQVASRSFVFVVFQHYLLQDSWGVYEAVNAEADHHIFGVFDGHGEHGTECAQVTDTV